MKCCRCCHYLWLVEWADKRTQSVILFKCQQGTDWSTFVSEHTNVSVSISCIWHTKKWSDEHTWLTIWMIVAQRNKSRIPLAVWVRCLDLWKTIFCSADLFNRLQQGAQVVDATQQQRRPLPPTKARSESSYEWEHSSPCLEIACVRKLSKNQTRLFSPHQLGFEIQRLCLLMSHNELLQIDLLRVCTERVETKQMLPVSSANTCWLLPATFCCWQWLWALHIERDIVLNGFALPIRSLMRWANEKLLFVVRRMQTAAAAAAGCAAAECYLFTWTAPRLVCS